MTSTVKTIQMQGRLSGPQAQRPDLRLLSHQRLDDGSAFYRIIADEKHIKNVTIIHNTNADSTTDVMLNLSYNWRAGDWSKAVVRETKGWVGLYFTEVSWTEPSGRVYDNGFLHRVVDFNDLSVVDSHGSNGQVVTCPQFPGQPVIFRHATSAEHGDSMKHEMEVYGWLADATGPLTGELHTFLAHVRLNDVVIGFLIEHISSRRPDLNVQKDVDACARAVQHLHKHGIVHGDINLDTLQIRSDSQGNALKCGPYREHNAVFMDFSKAVKAGTSLHDEVREEVHVQNFLAKRLDDVRYAEIAQYAEHPVYAEESEVADATGDEEDAVIVGYCW